MVMTPKINSYTWHLHWLKKNLENWGWFMSWLRREVTGPEQFCVIFDQHKAIKVIFEYPQYGWSEENGDAVHRYCIQHVSKNLYKTILLLMLHDIQLAVSLLLYL
jgi:hypothetical protein